MGIQEFQSHRQPARKRGHHRRGPPPPDLRSLRHLELHPGRHIHLSNPLHARHLQLRPQLLTVGVHWLQFLLDSKPNAEAGGGAEERRPKEVTEYDIDNRDFLYAGHHHGDGHVRQAASATQNG